MRRSRRSHNRPSRTIHRTLELLAADLGALALTAAVLVLVHIPHAGPSVGTAAAAGSTKTELVRLRTATSKTYRNPNGTYSTVLYADPIQYRDRNGDWRPIDSGLVPSRELGYAFATKSNSFMARFKDRLAPEYLSVERGDIPFTFTLTGAGKARARVEGSHITYPNVREGVDLGYDLSSTNVKETLVLQDRTAPARFQFVIGTRPGDHPIAERLPDGSIGLRLPEDSKPTVVLTAPYATERADGARSARSHASFSFRQVRNHVALELSIDRSWLRAPGRRFPVLVDPTIEVQQNTLDASFRTSCSTCLPTVGPNLLIGTEASNVWRSALQFDLGDIPPGVDVSSVRLKLYHFGWCIRADGSCGGAPHDLDVHRLTRPWSHASPSSELAFDGTILSTFTLPTNAPRQWMGWDVTGTVKNWLYANAPNYGLLVKRRTEPPDMSGPFPPSSRTNEPTLAPRLEVTYTTDGVELLAPVTLHSNGADLSWTAWSPLPGGTFERYEVHRSPNRNFTPSRATRLATISNVNTTTFRDIWAAPGGTFTYKIVANGTPSNERTVTLPPDGQASKVLQPNAVDGNETYLYWNAKYRDDTARGAEDTLWVGPGANDRRRILLSFNLQDIQSPATIQSASLSLWRAWGMYFAAPPLRLHRVTTSWNEKYATWYMRDKSVPWLAEGGDYELTPSASLTIPNGAPQQWDSFDVRTLVQRWIDASAPNYGALIKLDDELVGGQRYWPYHSDDWVASPTLRPKLSVVYSDNSHAIAPTVRVSEPLVGAQVKGTVRFAAAATDDRRVDTVEFRVDGKLLRADHLPPFEISWNSKTATNGSHRLSAKAIDDAGNTTTSAEVPVTVANSAAPTTSVRAVQSASYAQVVLHDRPLGYWRLGDPSVSTTAADSSGHGHHGSYRRPHVQPGVPGALSGDTDTAANFSGTGADGDTAGDVLIGDESAFDFGTADFTVEAWVKTTLAGERVIVAKGIEQDPPVRNWQVTVTDDAGYQGRARLKIFDGNTAWCYYGPNITINDGAWHHVAFVVDRASGGVGYVDGVANVDDHRLLGDVSNDVPLRIGKMTGRQHLNGDADEVAVYARTLPGARVRAHYRAGRRGSRLAYRQEVLASTPDSYFRLGEVRGAGWAKDISGNANDLIYEPSVNPGASPGALANDADTAASFSGFEADPENELERRDNASLDFGTGDFTAEAWVKTGLNGDRVIVSKCCRAGEPYWRLLVTDDPGHVGQASAKIFDGTTTLTAYGPSTTVDNNQWHHVAAAFDRDYGIRIIVDGIENFTLGRSQGDVSNSADFEVGDADDAPLFVGTLDEVAVYPRALPAERIRAHNDNGRSGTGYEDLILGDEPRGYWRLGEPTDWTTAYDETGHQVPARYQGPLTGVDGAFAGGDSNTAARFDGGRNDPFVRLGDRYDFAGTAPFSVEAWIKPTDEPGFRRIASKEHGSDQIRYGWNLYIKDSSTDPAKYWIGFERYPGTQYGDGIATPAIYPTGVWTHVVATYDGSTMVIYVNGARAVTGTGRTQPISDNPQPFMIGGSAWGGGFWDGDLDEVAVYTRSLPEREVEEHYDAASGEGQAVAGTATVEADASDDVAVDKVEFYFDSILIGTDTTAPYSVPWNTLDQTNPAYDGTHHLTTKAYDRDANVTTSAPLRVNVENTAGTKYRAAFSSTNMPDSVPYDSAEPNVTDVDVSITNTSNVTWAAGQVGYRCRWVNATSPDIVTECNDPVQYFATAFPPDETRVVTVHAQSPAPPSGTTRGQYRLRVDLYDQPIGDWFARQGNQPLEHLVTVNSRVPVGLGLERYYQYDGEDLGAGVQNLVNLASGNNIIRWTPFQSPGRGLSTVVDFTYNSFDGGSDTVLSNGWSMSVSTLSRLGTPLRLSQDGQAMELVDGDGTLHRFAKGGSGAGVYWKEPPGVHLFLYQPVTVPPDPDKTWALTRPDRVTFYYDAAGNPTSVQDKNGNRIVFTLETIPAGEQRGSATKRITGVTDASGTSRAMPNDRSFRIFYYSLAQDGSVLAGRVKRITDHTGSGLSLIYDPVNGNLTKIVQEGGTNADGTPLGDRTVAFVYDGATSRILSVTDPRSNRTTFEYRIADGKLQLRQNRETEQVSYSYGTDRVTTVVEPLSRVSTYAFDIDGKATALTNPGNERTRLIWSRDRHVTKVIEPHGAFVQYDYDDNGYLTDQLDELGNHTKLEYEYFPADPTDVPGRWAVGRTQPHISQLVRKTDPKGTATANPGDDFQWRFTYDERGNLLTATDPLGYVSTQAYNEDGTVSAAIDENRHRTAFSGYDPNGLPTVLVEPTGATTRFGYDGDGLLRFVQDPNHAGDSGLDKPSYRTYFYYDSFHRLGCQTAPKSTAQVRGTLISTKVAYDANDNIVSEFTPVFAQTSCQTGTEILHRYDRMDRATMTIAPPRDDDVVHIVTEFGYDGAGRLDEVTLPNAYWGEHPTIAYTYDELDRVVQETRLSHHAEYTNRYTRYCYDLAGDLRSVTAPKGWSPTDRCPERRPPAEYQYIHATHTTKRAYDAAHQLLSTTNGEEETSATTYDANGNVETQTNEEGTTSRRVYDERGEVVETRQPFEQSETGRVTRMLTSRLEYDPAGNVVRAVSPRAFDAAHGGGSYPFYVTSYEYDASDRLVKVKLPKDDSTRQAWVHNAYDANGNVLWTSVPVDTSQPALVEDAQKTVTTYFDPGWVKTSDEPIQGPTTFDYNAQGLTSSRIPAQGARESREYFYDGLLSAHVETQDNQDSRNEYSYDMNGNFVHIKDATGVDDGETSLEARLVYNDFDEVTKTTQWRTGEPEAQGRRDEVHYDANGNVDTRTDDAAGTPRNNSFFYDQADRLTEHLDRGAPNQCRDDQRLTYDYLRTGWAKTEKIYKSDATGSCTPSSWPLRQQTAYTYFRSGDLRTQQTWKGDPTSNNLVESHTRSYMDDSGVYVNGHPVSDEFTLKGPPPAGEPAAVCESPCTARYGYDAMDRLVSWQNGLPGTHSISTTYTLDHDTAGVDRLAGDITREVSVTGTSPSTTTRRDFSYLPNGQLWTMSRDGQLSEQYRYYPGGNLRCAFGPSQSDCNGTTLDSYTWKFDRLRTYTTGRGGTRASAASYKYDAFDRQTQETESRGGPDTVTDFSYLGLTDQVGKETRGSDVKTYSYDSDGNRDGMRTSGTSGQTYSFARNPHGDVSLLIGETGGAQASYGYKPYGEVDDGLFSEGGRNQQNPLNPFRFNDTRFDSGSGSIDMGARRFSPDVSRFVQQDFYHEALSDLDLSFDPLTQNRYAFAGGNPTSFVEFDGHGFFDSVKKKVSHVVHRARDVVDRGRDFANSGRRWASGAWNSRVGRAARHFASDPVGTATRAVSRGARGAWNSDAGRSVRRTVGSAVNHRSAFRGAAAATGAAVGAGIARHVAGAARSAGGGGPRRGRKPGHTFGVCLHGNIGAVLGVKGSGCLVTDLHSVGVTGTAGVQFQVPGASLTAGGEASDAPDIEYLKGKFNYGGAGVGAGGYAGAEVARGESCDGTRVNVTGLSAGISTPDPDVHYGQSNTGVYRLPIPFFNEDKGPTC